VIELDGLRSLGLDLLRCGDRDLGSAPWRTIRRLTQPLDDAQSALHWHPDTRHQRRFARDAAALVLTRCADLSRPYWAWSAQDWARLIGTGAGELRQSWPGQVGSSARPYLLVYAYLLGGFTAFDRVGRFHRRSLAWRVFGKEPVDDAIGQIRDVLAGWGYHRRCERDLTALVCHVLLLNRSPLLEDLSSEVLAGLRGDPAMGQYFPGDLHSVHRAVAALGLVEPPAAPKYSDGPAAITGAPDAWTRWVERWHANVHPGAHHAQYLPSRAGQDGPLAGRGASGDHRALPVDPPDLRGLGRGRRPDGRWGLLPVAERETRPRRRSLVT
jgi:hypothetical protein